MTKRHDGGIFFSFDCQPRMARISRIQMLIFPPQKKSAKISSIGPIRGFNMGVNTGERKTLIVYE